MPTTTKTCLAAATAILGLAATSIRAQLLVYEGFDYGTAGADRAGSDLLDAQPDGSGGDVDAINLGGTWADVLSPNAVGNFFLEQGSLTFGDLPVSGNKVRSDTNANNDVYTRPITVGLNGASELWFSILANKLQNNFSAAEGGFVIGNQTVSNSRILLDDGSTGLVGFGVAPTTAGNNWTPYAWNGSSQSVGDAALTVATNGSETNLLVGKISFGTGTGGTDQYTLYYYDLTASGGNVVADELNLVAIASTIEVDVDESTLDTLSLTRQVNTAYDEIRIGQSLADAIGFAPDTTAPVLASTSPADEDTGVLVSANLIATFNEDVQAATGNITITNLDTVSDTIIAIDDVTQVTFSGDTVTINPTSDLAPNTNYAVKIAAGAIEDTSSNAFAGILDDTTWNFATVGDITPPTLSSTNPSDEATDVPINSNLVATFSESIAAGSGDLTVKNLSEGTESIIPVGDAQVTISGTDLTIDLTATLDSGDNYAVQIASGAVTDTTGNPFAGITDDTTWNFTTAADLIAPVLSGTVPADEATDVPLSANLVATFDEDIAAVAPSLLLDEDFESNDGGFTIAVPNKGTGTEWAHGDPEATDLGGGAVTEGAGGSTQAWGTNLTGGYAAGTDACLRSSVIDLTGVAGATLSFAQAIDANTGHTLTINVIDDASDAVIANIIPATGDADTNSADWTTVGPVAIPGAALGQAVRIEWRFTGEGDGDYLGAYIDDVQVAAVDAGASVTLRNLTDATETSIAISDSSQITISGSTLIINPAANLEPSKSYAVRIGATALTDLAGNPYGGIADDTSWNFSTAATSLGLLVYEGFQYADPSTQDGLQGQPDDPGGTDTDATGLTGTWSDATTVSNGNLFLKAGSLSFGNLLTSGNHVGSNTNANNDIFNRPLTLEAQDNIGAVGEIWFSVLAEKLQNSFSAAEGGFALANQVVGNARIFENDGTDGLAGFGFGPTTAGNDWTAYAWDGSTRFTGDASLTVGVGTGDVRLLVGQISFGTGTGGADVFTLYEYQLNGGSVVGGTLNQIASPLEADVDQSALNTINLTRQVNSNYDEIRIGTSLADVIPEGVGGGNDFSDWIAGFSVGGLDGFDDDFDGDGKGNGLENYFGTDPSVFSEGLTAGAVTTGGSNTFTFTHPLNDSPADDVTGAYIWSTDLETFYDDGAANGAGTTTVTFVPGTPSAGIVTVTATITGTVIPGKVFVAVEATQTP